MKSQSMYGSSEIFDANNAEPSYFNMDSDIDIPPIDSEDMLSDGGPSSPFSPPPYGGLQSPSVTPFGGLDRERRTHDDSEIRGERTMFFGREFLPENIGVAKPRPYSSIVLRY